MVSKSVVPSAVASPRVAAQPRAHLVPGAIEDSALLRLAERAERGFSGRFDIALG